MQVPLQTSPVQQLALVVHDAPKGTHSTLAPQVPVWALQFPPQQSRWVEQLWPCWRQVEQSSFPLVASSVQTPLQQSVPWLQTPPSGVQPQVELLQTPAQGLPSG